MTDPISARVTQSPAGYASITVTVISPLLPAGISENIGGYMTFITITNKGKGQQIERFILDPVDSQLPRRQRSQSTIRT